MKKDDNTTSLAELKELVVKFRKERDWEKYFTPKNVATSISIEAAELLEHFQWDLLMEENKEEIAKELADVLIFAFHFATLYDLDVTTVFKKKLLAAAKKYPIKTFNANTTHKSAYHATKKAYRKGKE